MILGAGIGWYPPEYAATGVKKSERGPRTDEILDIIMPLLEGETVTYDGEFYSISDVVIEPRLPKRPEIWIGGGSQLADPGSPDLPRFVDAVKKRILKTEGWIPRPTCPPEDIARDWAELQAYLTEHGRDPSTLTVAHENFVHLVLTNDREAALAEQHDAFLRVMSSARGPKYLETVYLFGTPDDIVESLQARVDAGVQRFMLHTMTPDPGQLEGWITEVIAHVEFPEP
jgi:alkanesulfonate monooxygenase SsuD/methylene tetrahydromethanopterin reductase-like flavin-dependent oxidoreductase (luciferase family)